MYMYMCVYISISISIYLSISLSLSLSIYIYIYTRAPFLFAAGTSESAGLSTESRPGVSQARLSECWVAPTAHYDSIV